MTSRYEISTKIIQVRCYGDMNRYVGAFSIFIDGGKGVIHSLVGSGFYDVFKSHCVEMMSDLGISELFGHVTPIHSRLIKRTIRNIANFEVVESVIAYGREMHWIKISKLEAT